ncbi:hypothetical protein HNY73_019832 [Argiope bruennichi]|uniref:CCDC66 domain-containing protein n=1 Tax=Argiope bruennichi TaxID=94029 RepID=A0A8T0E4V1_ARGBR|nr:hypothetical protein HNY73_019832 [Argiope bruennichi]
MVRPSGDESRQLPIAEVKPDSWSHNSPENSSKNDTVTLTKTQFQQILEAIGQSSVLNGASLSWSAPQTTTVSPTKLSPLSKVEQKRLQWEKERAEMIDWNPWGKPGAGAPPKKTQVVAPITTRTNNQLLMVQTSGAMPYTSSVPSGVPSCLPSPNCRILPNALDHSTFLPNNYTSVAQPIKPVPPVFKSSIAFGNSENELVSSDSYKREQWLKELGYQREEQRRYQEQIQMSQMSDHHWINKEDTESISISVDGSILPGANDIPRRNYMRGQGFTLDPVSAALAEERRLKAQEYQHAIRMQMEEKQRRQQAERERKKQEEEAEERRLEAERARIQAEYEEEQQRLKQKAEIEEKKQQALISAMQIAQAQAEMEKKSRKIQKLLPMQPENHQTVTPTTRKNEEQTNSLSNNMETQLKLEKSENGAKTEETNFSTQQNNAEKENSHLTESDCECVEKKELGIQTVPLSDIEKSSYVVDRVLTPSIFRVRARAGHAREFGTQTDIHYGKYTGDDAESTESNTSSFHSPVAAKRLVRVQHSKPYKAQRRPQCNESSSVSERPKWGVNQPSKSYVRMTERDPHFTKRKKMQELRKQHWARELAAQKANESSRKSTLSSYPSLRGRRAASSSDCTLGYSSSEFETRSYHQFRSNSTPRYQQPSGFRSDCGSAETIAYFNYSPSNHNSRFSRSFLHRRDSQSSDNLPSIIGGSEPSPSRRIDRFAAPSYGGSSLPPMRRKWHSQESFHPLGNYHIFSPPHVPGVYPRMIGETFRYELPPPLTTQRRKWSDQESFDLESVVRSKVAEGSRASSAESSGKSETASVSSAGSSKPKSPLAQNPLVCPEVVTGRPTPRQDRILQNLSSLRQGLIQKQKELESLIRRPPPFYS